MTTGTVMDMDTTTTTDMDTTENMAMITATTIDAGAAAELLGRLIEATSSLAV